DIVQPAHTGDEENLKRLIVVSEKHGQGQKWEVPAYSLFQETPYTFSSVKSFSCAPNRGGTNKPLFLINHWLRPDGPPDPTEANTVNSSKVLTNRFTSCIRRRNKLP